MADESIIVDLKTQGFKDLNAELAKSVVGFTELDKSLVEANKELAKLDKNSQAFKDLTKEINAATIASNAYSENTDTLKRELRSTTDEIGKLERALKALDKAGEKNSQTYKDIAQKQDELKKKAGQLKDTVQDLNAEIKNSGSDTKNLDKALRAIGAVAAGYQIAQGAMVLFGAENKKFEQALLKLNAIMAITNGLQQIQNELSKKDSLFTAAATKSKALYTAVTSGATVAVNAFRIALAAIGFGAVIAAVGLLVSNWDKLKTSIFGVTKTVEDYIKAKEKSLEISKKELEALDKELEYQVAIGAITEKRAKEIKIDELTKQLTKETDELEKQGKIYDDLKKKREEQGVASGFFVTAIIKSAFKVSKAELESQKNAITGQASIVKQLSVDLINAQNDLNKANKPTKAKLKEKVKELKEEVDTIFAQQKLIRDAEARHQKQLDDRRKQANENRKTRVRADGLEIIEENERLAKELEQQNADIDARELQKQKEKHDAMLESERKHAEKVAFILQQLSNVADAIGNITQQAISIRATNEINFLEEKRKKGLITEKQFERESAKIKEEAAKKQRAADIAIALAKIPLIFLQALVSAPFPFGVILASIASGIALAQVAILAASPLPQFKHGGQVSEKLGLIKGKSHQQGGVPIEVEGDEYVMPVKETRENLEVLQAIHKGKFKELFIPKANLIQPDIFANIPNPAMIDKPLLMDKDDYSSINTRLDKVANELWWLRHEAKTGNKISEKGTDRVVKAVQSKSKRYV